MTPSVASQSDSQKSDLEMQQAVSSCLDDENTSQKSRAVCSTLLKRRDFLKASKARRQATGSFLLQGRKRTEGEAVGIRIGYTCSKKVGNAVARNRAKRRLREAARHIIPEIGRDGWDYVLVGKKKDTSEQLFTALLDDLRYALKRVHSDKPRKDKAPYKTRAHK